MTRVNNKQFHNGLSLSCAIYNKTTPIISISPVLYSTKAKENVKFVLGLLLRTEAINCFPPHSSVVNPEDLSQLLLINHIHRYVFQHRGLVNHHLSSNI